jgi:hypothetical protein
MRKAAVLEPIEPHIRPAEVLRPGDPIMRGWPLNVDALIENADSTPSRGDRAGLGSPHPSCPAAGCERDAATPK